MSADDHRITLAQAIEYTHTWQKEHPGERRAWKLPREIIEEILKNPECASIRVYAGNVSGDERLVWIGTDATGKDLITGTIAEKCGPCPFDCDEGSPLMSPVA
ncbi:MAG: hypothetical protein V4558_09050 [Gemmatimonadota bacterium]